MIKTTSLGLATGAVTSVVVYEILKRRNQPAATQEDAVKKIARKPPNTLYIDPEIPDTSCTKLNEDVSTTFDGKRNMKYRHKAINSHTISYNEKYNKVVPKLFSLIQRAKEETGSPGISFAISHNGETVLKGGIGLADVENGVLCTSDTNMRIASISKSLTTVAIGKLIENGSLDIDKPVNSYLKEFGEKTYDGELVEITTRQLLSHTSGIRGYFEDPKEYVKRQADSLQIPKKSKLIKHEIMKNKFGDVENKKIWNENFNVKHFKTVQDGLAFVKDDPLIYKPGTDYEYSSLAYSLVSRIIEETSGKDYVVYMRRVCDELGMQDTCVDLNNAIILNRSKNYRRSKQHKLRNTEYVDNSYKWSGGGFLSNVNDLIRFGNNMLTSYSTERGYLKPETVRILWKPEKLTIRRCGTNQGYALGWGVKEKTNVSRYTVGHSGGAIGASSVLRVIPGNHPEEKNSKKKEQGTVIALIVNMQSVGLSKTADKLADILLEE